MKTINKNYIYKIKLYKKLGKSYDTRTVRQVYKDLKKIDASTPFSNVLSFYCVQNLPEEGKTKSASRVVPIHPVLEKLIQQTTYDKEDYLINDLNGGGYDNKRSWNFQKRQGRLRREVELPKGVVFHTLRNTFATHIKNAGVPRNHISQLMGHEDDNMALDVYSSGLAIEPLRGSISKLTYGSEVDCLLKTFLDRNSA